MITGGCGADPRHRRVPLCVHPGGCARPAPISYSCKKYIRLNDFFTTFVRLFKNFAYRKSLRITCNICVSTEGLMWLGAGYATSPPSGMLSKVSEEHWSFNF